MDFVLNFVTTTEGMYSFIERDFAVPTYLFQHSVLLEGFLRVESRSAEGL